MKTTKIQVSKTKIKKNLKKKTNPLTIETINLASKQKSWLQLAKFLLSSTRNYAVLNLEEINAQTKTGDIAVIPGKVLSLGEIDKKIKLCSLSFSKSASEKLKKSKIEFYLLPNEIKKNPDAKGVKILR